MVYFVPTYILGLRLLAVTIVHYIYVDSTVVYSSSKPYIELQNKPPCEPAEYIILLVKCQEHRCLEVIDRQPTEDARFYSTVVKRTLIKTKKMHSSSLPVYTFAVKSTPKIQICIPAAQTGWIQPICFNILEHLSALSQAPNQPSTDTLSVILTQGTVSSYRVSGINRLMNTLDLTFLSTSTSPHLVSSLERRDGLAFFLV